MKKLWKKLSQKFLIAQKLKQKNKWLSLFMAFFSMGLTIGFIKIMDTEKIEEDTVFIGDLEGKNAITISLKIENVPLEFIYPGAKVDIMKNLGNRVVKLAKDVPIVAISILDSETVRLIFAVDRGDEENIIQNKSENLSIILVGDTKKKEQVEIIEVK